MTRINCVPPEELTREHLLAEWRELPRVFALAGRAAAAGRIPPLMERYRLGAGHVTFFYRRLGYCARRFRALRRELLRRGYSPSYAAPPAAQVPRDWRLDWTPDADALAINRARIAERVRP